MPWLKFHPTEGNTIQVAGTACNSSRQIDLTPFTYQPCRMLRFLTVLPGAPQYDSCPSPSTNPKTLW